MITSFNSVVDDLPDEGDRRNSESSLKEPRSFRNGAVPSLGAVVAFALAFLLMGCEAKDPAKEARKLVRQGRLEAATELLRDALDENSEDPETLYLYGRALSMSGRPSLAEWSLRKAMLDPEWKVLSAMQVAYGAFSSHSFDESIAAANIVLEVEPEHTEALLLRANAYVESRRFAEEGLAETDRLLELDPTNARAFRPRVIALLDLERFDEAGEALEALGVLIEEGHGDDKTDVWHCATMAVFTSDGGDVELAEEKFASCRERFPGDPSIVQPAVEFYDGQQKYAKSVEVLREALAVERSPEYRFWVGLAERLRVLGPESAEEALEIMRSAPLEVPDATEQARRWVELAEFLKQQGDTDGAIEALELAIATGEMTPRTSPDLFFATAELYLRAGNQERALDLANSFHVKSHRAMIEAAVAQARGEHEEALAAYSEAGRLWPDNAFARYHAARAAMALGQVDRALEEYRHSARISPSDTDAPVAAARILVERREFRPALEAIGQRRGAWLEEAGLLHVEISARSLDPSALDRSLEQLATQHPESYSKGVARAVATLLEAGEPKRARRVISRIPRAIWSHPSAAPALRAAIRLASAPEAFATAKEISAALLRNNPANASLLEVEAYRLLRTGASATEVQEAVDKVLEIEPSHGLALLTLAESLEDEPASRRIEVLQRASTRVPSESSPELLRLCQAMAAEAPSVVPEIIQLLDARLTEFPVEGGTALALAKLASQAGDDAVAGRSAARAGQLGYAEQVRDLRGAS